MSRFFIPLFSDPNGLRTLYERPTRYPHFATLPVHTSYCLMEAHNMDGRNLSHLFTIRLWFESADHESSAIRIRVHHVLSGDVRYFREWMDAMQFIAEHSFGQENLLSKPEEDSV